MELNNEIFRHSISLHEETLDTFKNDGFPVIEEIVQRLAECFENGGKVLLIGNGGSAADCQHIAGELVGRFEKERPPLPAISLASDTSVMTCIANDYEYESLFARQVEALARPGDLLWALSTSGESPNILRAAEWAKENGITVISFTGSNESTLENISDHCLCVGTRNTARVQEIHQLAYHIICRYLDNVHSVSP